MLGAHVTGASKPAELTQWSNSQTVLPTLSHYKSKAAAGREAMGFSRRIFCFTLQQNLHAKGVAVNRDENTMIPHGWSRHVN